MKAIKIIKRFFICFLTILLLLIAGSSLTLTANDFSLAALFTKKSWFWLVLSSLCLSLLAFSWSRFEEKQQQQEIRLLNKKLQKILAGQKAEHLLLAPTDRYYQLAQSINQIQSLQRNLAKSFVTQQRGYFSLIEYLTIGVMVLDQDQKIYLSNHAMSELMEREMNLPGEIYANELRNYDLSRLIEKTYQTKKEQHAEIKLDFNNKIVDSHIVFVPVSHHHFLVMVLLYDITELKEIEQMQLDFVSNVSHELKTPITAITGFSETLLNGAADDPTALKEFLKIIHQESQKLTALVEDILSLARISANAELKTDQISLFPYLQEIIQTFKPEIDKKQIRIFNEVPPAFKIVVDYNKFRHVVNNLLQNAIKYNDPTGSVWLSSTQFSKTWEFKVRDNGWGIANDQRERIFERFYRIDTSRSKQTGGTGLGLSVVKEYVAAMGGTIKVTSQVGVGSEFTVTLPLIQKRKQDSGVKQA